MKFLSHYLTHIATWKNLLFFLVIYMVFNGYILKNAENKINELAGKSIGVIDLTFGFNPRKTLKMVAEYGVESREYYTKCELTADVIYPIVYAFLFGIILTMVYRVTSYSWINGLPFLALFFDYLENITIVLLLISYPEQSITIATLCEIFKLVKWLVFGVIILLIIIGLVSKLLNRNKLSTQ